VRLEVTKRKAKANAARTKEKPVNAAGEWGEVPKSGQGFACRMPNASPCSFSCFPYFPPFFFLFGVALFRFLLAFWRP